MEAKGVFTNKKSSKKPKPCSPTSDLSGQMKIGLQNPHLGKGHGLQTHNLHQWQTGDTPSPPYPPLYTLYTKALSNENGLSVFSQPPGIWP